MNITDSAPGKEHHPSDAVERHAHSREAGRGGGALEGDSPLSGAATIKNMVRAGILTASQCATYDAVKEKVLEVSGWKDGFPAQLVTSMATGLVTTTVTAPVDTIKSRVFVGELASPITPPGGNVQVYDAYSYFPTASLLFMSRARQVPECLVWQDSDARGWMGWSP
eukprot:scaffold39591_cov27-Prasinocladus_malaysianus.AAC.1